MKCANMLRRKQKMFRFFKKKNSLNQYPCDIYLHNALRFTAEGKSDAAYTEICCAIMRSGGILSDKELQKYRELTNK